MDVSCPSLPSIKLVGVELRPRPHHAARICALGCRSAMCNLCIMLVIIFDLPHSRSLRERNFISQPPQSCQEVFQKNFSTQAWITSRLIALPECYRWEERGALVDISFDIAHLSFGRRASLTRVICLSITFEQLLLTALCEIAGAMTHLQLVLEQIRIGDLDGNAPVGTIPLLVC